MEFTILGPVEVRSGGRKLPLGGGKQRTLLAALLLESNRVVSADRLIDLLWEDDPPETARKALQVHVAQLRKLLGADRIVTDGPGYRMRVEPDELDLEQFRLLVQEGGAERLEAALALWRGTPLGNLPASRFTSTEVARLEELRLSALEERFEASLARGAGPEVVAELEALVARNPLRERLRALLMLALYRAGRQADALEAYQQARRVLVDELGIDPGRRLRELEGAILRQDPALDAAAVATSTEAAPAPRRSSFVGRERELAELSAALQTAAAGSGSLYLLAGEPGIGKSRLAEELVATARASGATALVGRCWEAGGAPAYWPWTRLLRQYVQQTDANVLRAQLGRGAADVAQLVPDLYDVLPNLAAPSPADSGDARFRLFDATTAFLKNAAAARPLVLVLDDVHAADEPTLVLLRFVAHELADSRLLVIAAYRDVDPTLAEPLRSAVAELAREPVTRIVSLRGLAEPEVARLIELTAVGAMSETLPAFVHAETDGNPFFVGEIVRLLAEEGRLEGVHPTGPTVPQSVQEVVGRRVRHLSPGCARVLTLASVLGREFDVDTLSRVDEHDRAALLELLDEAIAARVVSEVPGAVGRLRFAHGLIRESVYETLTSARRAQLHRLVGEALEDRYRDDVDAHAAELAHHFYAARPAGETEKALQYLVRAADGAARVLAYEEAVRLYDLALGLTDARNRLRCDLLLALGDAHARGGDAGESKRAFLEAAELAQRLGASDALARAALGYGGRILWHIAADDEHVVPLLESALAAVGEEDSVLRVLLLSRLAGGPLRALRFPPEKRVSLSREALEMARRIGDPAALAYALAGYITANLSPRFTPEQVERSTELIAVATRAGDKERAMEGHEHRVVALLELGDVDGANADLDAMARLADELRQPAQRWCAMVDRGMMLLLEGRFAEAERASREALDVGERVQGNHASAAYTLQLYLLRREQGRVAEVAEVVRAAADALGNHPLWLSVLADVQTKLGDERAARRSLEQLGAGGFAAVPFDEEWLATMTLAAETAAAVADVDHGRALYELLLPFRDRVAVSYLEFVMGAVARYLGVLAALLSRLEEAERHFEDALELNAHIGARAWLAHTQRDYARMLLRRDAAGDAARARRLLDEALPTYAALGMAAPAGEPAAVS